MVNLMINYYIAGAGGLGRVAYHILQERIRLDTQLSAMEAKICGFLDDDFFALSSFKDYPPVICGMSDYIPKATEQVIVAVGNPKVRRQIVKTLKKKIRHFPGLFIPKVFFTAHQ